MTDLQSQHSTRVPCDCPVGSHPSMGDRGRCQELRSLQADFTVLGSVFVRIYLMALNGAVCDPGESACEQCADFFAKGKALLVKYDKDWGNMYRSGAPFQPFSAQVNALGSFDSSKETA